MSLHGEVGVEDARAVLAGVSSWVVVNRSQVLAMDAASLERRATHVADERPTTAVH